MFRFRLWDAAPGIAIFGFAVWATLIASSTGRKVQPRAVGKAATVKRAEQRPTPVVALDATAYNAQLLAIANLPQPQLITTVHWVRKGKADVKTETKTLRYAHSSYGVPLRDLWPVRAPLPEAGALLPFNRVVAYYGNLYSTHMGVLGEYPAPQMLAMLAKTAAAWQAADPSTRVLPALDYIAVAAQASAGDDGRYRMRMPPDQIGKVLQMAQQIHGLVFLDVQVGQSNVRTEVPLLAPYLKLPQVELALDPEFAMRGARRPGTVVGTLDAADVNWTAQYLAGIVQASRLAPKILVVHRFTQEMVTDYRQIHPLAEVQIVMDMDGFGTPAQKIRTYDDFIESEPVQFTGFKLFYRNDLWRPGSHLLTPAEILKLHPRPSYIQYQ